MGIFDPSRTSTVKIDNFFGCNTASRIPVALQFIRVNISRTYVMLLNFIRQSDFDCDFGHSFRLLKIVNRNTVSSYQFF